MEHPLSPLTDFAALKDLVDRLPAGIGIYQIYFDGRIEMSYLNDGYYAMIGADRRLRKQYEGFSALKAVHPDDTEMLRGEVNAAIQENRQLQAEIRVLAGKGGYKWLGLHADIVERFPDHVTIYCAYSDIHRNKEIQLHLEAERRAVVLASQSGETALWVYDLSSHCVAAMVSCEGTLEGMLKNPGSTEGVYPDDIPACREMFARLNNGAPKSESTVRLRNQQTGEYEWQTIRLMRQSAQDGIGESVIGCAVKVQLQKEAEMRFEKEAQLRHELNKSAESYFEMNLSTGIVEEFYDQYDMMGVKAPFPFTAQTAQAMLVCVCPEDLPAVRSLVSVEEVMRLYNSGESRAQLEYRRTTPKGGVHWMRGTLSVMKRPNTEEIIAFVSIMDIDVEKKQRLALDSIISEELESVILLNPHTKRIILVQENRPLGKYLPGSCFALDESFRASLFQGLLPEDIDRCSEFIRTENITKTLETQAVDTCIYRVMSPRGKIERKKVRAFYLDKYHDEIVFVRQDITDLYEEEQRQKQALHKAIDEANAANLAKSEFLSRVSHDMRTPLNAIIGLTSDELTQGLDCDELRTTVNKVNAAGEFLLGIINDVLDMSKIESHKMALNLEPYRLGDFVRTIDTIIGEQCRLKGVLFQLQTDADENQRLMLDKVRIDQIFLNLLSNAVKFTPKGGTVTLALEQLFIRGSRIKKRFTVRDTGIGMSPGFVPHAFDRFAQEQRKDASQNNQGTGLGLAIVKELVALMGGAITLESQLGKGSTFVVELETELLKDESTSADEAAQPIDLTGVQVLLCEDHPLNTEIAVRLLRKRGCEVTCAKDGQQGLERFRTAPPGYFDLILMDLRMPVMDGLTATKAIRAIRRPDAQSIPIIAMTANAFDEDVKSSLEAGMDAHLAKPIEPDKLYGAIENAVRNGRGSATAQQKGDDHP